MQARPSAMQQLRQAQHPHHHRQALPRPPRAAGTSASARPPPLPPRAPAAAASARARVPRRARAAAGAAAEAEAADAPSGEASSSDGAAAPAKTPWYSKNAEGWTTLSSAGELARAAHAARSTGRRVLALDLYAPWCGVCKSSWPALSRLARDPALSAEVAFCKASIDDDDIRRLIKEQGVTGIPYVLVLDVGAPGAGGGAPEPPSEAGEAVGLVSQLFRQFLAKRGFGGGKERDEGAAAAAGAAGAAAAPAAAAADEGGGGGAAAAQPRVLDAVGATLLLGQGAAFKRIAVLRSNLAAVPAMARRGHVPVVVDPNGLVVAAVSDN